MTTKRLRILVLICTTRPNALGPAVGRWLIDTLAPEAERLGADLVPLAIGDLGLPFLDEEEHPSTGVHHHDHTRRWSRIVAEADGFVFVTPEYNYGMPATLKNALDYLSPEWAWKPVGFVSYGHTSAGTRAVQHAKQVVTTLRLVPLGATVALRIADALRDGRLEPEARHADAAQGLLAELVRAARALAPMREREHAASVEGPLPGSYARRLGPDDAAEVTVLQRCCWMEEALANDTLAIPALHESPADVRAWLADWDATGLWRDGRLLGMVRTRRIATDLHVGRLAVAPDLRGLGVGRWLLSRAESTAEEGDRIVLSTGAASHRNIALYERQGYVVLPGTWEEGVVDLVKPAAA
ncbi:bifunctional NAD(P)H-dependent oxidoreductase/GNAT family N-acetyltransferase [Streptomyces cyaneofuscatus]|uniref:bifunctional NAD(P)H-dependent oxidoreductase/GNAT family N-acetyltransferase n=1 Tax=Streptomyces cyaneofuscatus TaxID=66883 RepID=UPI0029532BA5|nr:bifunctional NAD(P)H-dependent oxidoreductase/GNAT family N-acetyltransferase [Streptomyces cyaneofuscatus]WOP11726.1 bifunctional NAD(P)H-dependent oxidoreductase/GNAT family N-acetyltransferase [Streptomyces cyaneofuscatus]